MMEQLKRNIQLLIDLIRSSLRQWGLLKREPTRFWHYKTRDGFEFKMRHDVCDSVIFAEIWWLNSYFRALARKEGAKRRHFRALARKEGAVVIDIGAHIGFFSIFAASKAKAVKVFAFEPNPDNFALLKENIRINRLEEKIFPFQAALAAEGGKKIRFNLHPDNLGMHSAVFSHEKLWGGEKAPSFEAETISLEELFQKNGLSQCDFLKMDCEGCEYPVLLSAPENTLKKIKNLALEYHSGGDIRKVRQRLEQLGFKTRFDYSVPIIGRLTNGAPLLKAWRGV